MSVGDRGTEISSSRQLRVQSLQAEGPLDPVLSIRKEEVLLLLCTHIKESASRQLYHSNGKNRVSNLQEMVHFRRKEGRTSPKARKVSLSRYVTKWGLRVRLFV